MAVTDRFKRAADHGRRVAAAYGQRDVVVTLVVETWSDAVGRDGATLHGYSATPLDPPPKVTQASAEPSAFGGGGYVARAGGDVAAQGYVVGPITKRFPGGGYDRSDLLAQGGSGKRVYYTLSGDEFDGAEKFRVASVVRETPQSIWLELQRTEQ